MKNGLKLIVLLGWCLTQSLAIGQEVKTDPWVMVSAGLEIASFSDDVDNSASDSNILIVRIDAALWEVMPYAASQEENDGNLTAKQWCKKNNLVAAINAGMYQADFSTHCGYMKVGSHINNGGVVKTDYRSVAGFGAVHDSLPPFRMFDLDENNISDALQSYSSIVQNIRLIKRPGENRWPQKKKRWSEAALGEDTQGRVLFIFCRSPHTMHDLNEILLSLPIDLVAAQHLEGGPEAQLFFRLGDTEIDVFGSYETGFNETNSNFHAWRIPNIIGVRAR